MASAGAIVASFIESAPPGELTEVTNDVKALTSETPGALSSLNGAFKNYNEEQFATVKLPGGSQSVIVSAYNSLDGGRYYDPESQSSFAFDHSSQKASDVQSYTVEGNHADTVKSLLKALSSHVAEHYPNASYGAYPSSDGIQILIAANKYSPNNFWNGRWRSHYTYSPTSGSIQGKIRVDVHYYEDGNVRLLTDRPVSSSVSSSAGASEIVRIIAGEEKKYQEDLNRGFSSLSEGAFKSLRRQLPITRQKIEWEKIGGYRLGQDIGGGRAR